MDKKINEIWVNFSHFLGNGKSQDEFYLSIDELVCANDSVRFRISFKSENVRGHGLLIKKDGTWISTEHQISEN